VGDEDTPDGERRGVSIKIKTVFSELQEKWQMYVYAV
jgi:hypothetical protein